MLQPSGHAAGKPAAITAVRRMEGGSRQKGLSRLALALSLALPLALPLWPAVADDSPAAGSAEQKPLSFLEALRGGETSLSLRYCFENVEQGGFDKDARASTLRTTLAYKTGAFHGFQLFVEAEDVAELGANDLYANRGAGSLNNGVADRPVVADPAGTEMNQLGVSFSLEKTKLHLGRQEIAWADQRFVGPVGWRQNHQAFDALAVTTSHFPKAELQYFFLDRVHRIFGDSKPMASHGLSGKFQLPFGSLRAYGLLLDFDRILDAASSSSTYGLEYSGKRSLGKERSLHFELELAQQEDTGDNPARLDAGYLHALVGGALSSWTLEAGFERLEGSPEDGSFSTPLATLHKWNGWADKFLRTPQDGLEDLYLVIRGSTDCAAGKVSWLGAFHDFGAESSGLDYGQEIDLQLTLRSHWSQVFGLKAALYNADSFSTDTDKLWLWTSYSF